MKCPIPFVLVLVFLVASACGNGDVAPLPDAGNDFRPEGPNPRFDAGNSQDDEDASSGDPDLGGCGADACEPGEVRCTGAGVQTCEPVEECGVWGEIIDCENPGELCVEGSCQIPDGCVDNDDDGFGVQCAAGADCDDADPTTYDGATEICDEKDNDCDQEVDEDFQLGGTCTSGVGGCEASGVLACAPDGTVACDATPPTGAPEVCDGLDNDCDGAIDNGVCGGGGAFCASDIYEPNDTLAQAEPVTPGTPLLGLLCPSDTDFMSLVTQPNKQYRLNIAFPEARADLSVNSYIDGVAQQTFNSSGDDWVMLDVETYMPGAIAFAVENPEAVDTFFRVGFVETSQLRCGDEDGFAPNQRIQDSFPLVRNWEPYVYMCPSNGGANNRVSDWYSLGEVMQGETIIAETLEDELIFSDDYDLDIYLWADPDGDNTFTVENSAASFDDAELISQTAGHTGRRYLEVRDYDGNGGEYWVRWSIN